MNNCTQSLELVTKLIGLNQKMLKRIDGQLSIHGINYSELMVLHHLNSASLQTMRRIDLAEHIGLTASGITRMLKPMEKLHLVEKESNARDARVSLVKLTAVGETLYKDAWQSFNYSSEQFSHHLTNDQLNELIPLLSMLQ